LSDLIAFVNSRWTFSTLSMSLVTSSFVMFGIGRPPK
jgi:hypothetical protein